MTSLAGGTKSKKEDEPNKKVVLKREDVTVIVIFPAILSNLLDERIRNLQDCGRKGSTAKPRRTQSNNPPTHQCIIINSI
jgi:hypothetical protein